MPGQGQLVESPDSTVIPACDFAELQAAIERMQPAASVSPEAFPYPQLHSVVIQNYNGLLKAAKLARIGEPFRGLRGVGTRISRIFFEPDGTKIIESTGERAGERVVLKVNPGGKIELDATRREAFSRDRRLTSHRFSFHAEGEAIVSYDREIRGEEQVRPG